MTLSCKGDATMTPEFSTERLYEKVIHVIRGHLQGNKQMFNEWNSRRTWRSTTEIVIIILANVK